MLSAVRRRAPVCDAPRHHISLLTAAKRAEGKKVFNNRKVEREHTSALERAAKEKTPFPGCALSHARPPRLFPRFIFTFLFLFIHSRTLRTNADTVTRRGRLSKAFKRDRTRPEVGLLGRSYKTLGCSWRLPLTAESASDDHPRRQLPQALFHVCFIRRLQKSKIKRFSPYPVPSPTEEKKKRTSCGLPNGPKLGRTAPPRPRTTQSRLGLFFRARVFYILGACLPASVLRVQE